MHEADYFKCFKPKVLATLKLCPHHGAGVKMNKGDLLQFIREGA